MERKKGRRSADKGAACLMCVLHFRRLVQLLFQTREGAICEENEGKTSRRRKTPAQLDVITQEKEKELYLGSGGLWGFSFIARSASVASPSF